MAIGVCVSRAALTLLILPATIVSQSPLSDTLAIEHAAVIPMDRDTALVDQTVLVWQDRIVWVGPSRTARIPRRARRLDARGAFLMPGLVDMHVHLERVEELGLLLDAGVTTVRVMHGAPKHLEWRERIARGALSGPTIFSAGPPLGEGGAGFVPLKGTADAERVVRQQALAAYDLIKVIGTMSLPVYRRVLEVAREVGIPVVGHVIPRIGLEQSLSAGQVSLEHAYALRNRSRLASLFGNEQAQLDEDARAIARAGAWVGTVASSRSGSCEPRSASMLNRVTTLHRAKVKLLAGTDAGIGAVRPGVSLHCELATLVAAGLTPYEALATATANAGAFAKANLRRQPVPFGTVTVGSRADLLLLSKDPRLDIKAVARPLAVVVRGVVQPR